MTGAGETFAAFLRLGAEHVWLGFDHLMFLAGLLIVARDGRAVAVVITMFTVAHSLTLGLAALGVVRVRADGVELVIAASIVWVGVENLARRGEPRGRAVVAFGFGLVHGLGFAGVLRDLGLGGGWGALVPLAGFNLGVELGQLAVAGVAVPVWWRLRRRADFAARWQPALSAAVAVAGAAWMVARWPQW